MARVRSAPAPRVARAPVTPFVSADAPGGSTANAMPCMRVAGCVRAPVCASDPRQCRAKARCLHGRGRSGRGRIAIGKTGLRAKVDHALEPVTAFLVPLCFAVMGTLVNFQVMAGAGAVGLLISALAVVSKVLGCGAPALWLGFNRLGATRIRIGMLPRGMAPILLVPLLRSRAGGLNA